MKSTGVAAEQQTSRRLFFALWPNDDVRQQLVSKLCSLPEDKRAKHVVPQNLHITLSFLGSINKDVETCVRSACAGIKLPGFTLEMDKLIYRHKQGMVWLESAQIPAALLSLAASVESVCRNCGIETEDRPYKAHLTVMRKVRSFSSAVSIEPIIWPVNSFVLVSSQTLPEGAVYQMIERWPLASGAMNQDD